MNLFLKKIISKIIIKLIIPIYKIFYNQKVNDLKFLIGNSFLKTERYNYNKYKYIEESYYRIFSQNSEDGVLDYLLYCLNLKDPKFCEIGTEDYQEANTRYIYEKNSGTGFIIDCISNYKFKVQKNLRLWRGNLNVIEKKISPDNVIEIFNSYKILDNLDLFSLDIDGIDYFVLEKLPNKFSKIAVIEYNALFGDKYAISVPNLENFDKNEYHYSQLCFGASLRAIINLMKTKDFTFIGCNEINNNAFFLNNDFLNHYKLTIPNTDNLKKYTELRKRDSRNEYSFINYLNLHESMKIIEDCEVLDLQDNSLKKFKSFS